MTYNGLGLQSYGRRARRAHFLLDGLILVPYMDASAVSRLGQQFLRVSSKILPAHTAQGLYNRSFWLCVQYLG